MAASRSEPLVSRYQPPENAEPKP